jgi:hypothetical protein
MTYNGTPSIKGKEFEDTRRALQESSSDKEDSGLALPSPKKAKYQSGH